MVAPVAKLHPTLWRDLLPEFAASKQLRDVEQMLVESCAVEGKDTANLAQCLASVRDALKRLHPVTQDPEAVDEFEARLNGTFEEPSGSTGPNARRPRDTKAELERERELAELRDRDVKRDGEMAEMRKQLDALLASKSETKPSTPKGETKGKGEST